MGDLCYVENNVTKGSKKRIAWVQNVTKCSKGRLEVTFNCDKFKNSPPISVDLRDIYPPHMLSHHFQDYKDCISRGAKGSVDMLLVSLCIFKIIIVINFGVWFNLKFK